MAFLPRNLRNAIGRWGAAALILVGKEQYDFAGMSSVRKRTQLVFLRRSGVISDLTGC